MPPCRLAAMAIVPCPLCARQVTTKTLRYSHRCGRTFHTAPREEEQRKLAENAVIARMGKPGGHRVVQTPLQARPAEQRMELRPLQARSVEQRVEQPAADPSKYAHFFNQFGHGQARRAQGGF
jgi:hypothetical protein